MRRSEAEAVQLGANAIVGWIERKFEAGGIVGVGVAIRASLI